MEPLNDKELNHLLRKWEAPAAPPTMAVPTNRSRQPLWQWLWVGRIHVPVPVGLGLVLAAAAFAVYSSNAVPTAVSPAAGNAVVGPEAPKFSPNPPAAPVPAERTLPAVIENDKAVTAALSGFQPVQQLEPKVVQVQP